jgi:monoamine oxidase
MTTNNSRSAQLDCDVVVVGAGLAGLAAARRLTKESVHVVVLESRDRVGGRVVNHRFADGVVVEVGGQWVGPTQDRILGLIDELHLETFESYDDGESLVVLDGTVKRFTGDSFGLPPHVLIEAGIVQKRLEKMASTVPLDAPWTAARADQWDGETVESWLRRHVRQERVREFWRLVVTAIFSTEARDMSLLHFLFYCRSGGMLDRLMNTTGGAQERRIVGGSQRIAEVMTEHLGSAVVCSARVTEIHNTSADSVVVETGDATDRAAAVIVTIPPHLTTRIAFDPPLDGKRAQLVQKMPMGAVIKCIVRYRTAFWRTAGLNGFSAALGHPVSLTFDNSPPDASCGLLLAFIEGAHARRVSALTRAERERIVVDAAAERFGAEAREVLEYVDLDWTSEVDTGGCYGAHLAPGVWTQLGSSLRRPHGRVHWAGTETATTWNGYMDGAFESGYRAADEVRATLAHTAVVAAR